MGKDLTETQMGLGEVEGSPRPPARAQVVEVLGEAKNQASVVEEVRAAEVRASKATVEVVENFKIGGEYCQVVLDSCKKAF